VRLPVTSGLIDDGRAAAPGWPCFPHACPRLPTAATACSAPARLQAARIRPGMPVPAH